MRLYFIAYVFILLFLTVAVTAVLFGVLNFYMFTRPASFSLMISMLLVSIALGTGITAFFSKKILSPVTKLSDAIHWVALGDFSVELETASSIREVQDTYANFNLMVQELRATETLQSDFISNVSHEFKTPLNAIEGYTTLLQEFDQLPQEQLEYTQKILFNTGRLSELVGNILLLGKVENQTIPLEKTQYRLDEQIRQAVLILEPKWTQQEVDFDVELPNILYCGSEGILLHVWMNLLDNAIKFSPRGQSVAIGLEQTESEIRCSITDHGPGISPEVQRHIFDKFYQADSSHKQEGNGLGLALVKKILDTCGGSIQILSSPGNGATFLVTLPKGES